MQAFGENRTRTAIDGWIDFGGILSTSNRGMNANGETAEDVIPDSIQLDRAALDFERLPDFT
jgi:hypothetical protein